MFLISCDLKSYPRIHPRGGLLSEEEKARLSLMTAKDEDQEWLSRFLALKERGDIAGASYARRSESGTGFCSTLLPELPREMHGAPLEETRIVERSSAGLRLRYHVLLDEYVRFGYEGKELAAYRERLLSGKGQEGAGELGALGEASFPDRAIGEASAMLVDKGTGRRVSVDLTKVERNAEILYPLFDIRLLPLVPRPGSAPRDNPYRKPLTPSALEDFYSCPFLFFAKEVLRLDPFESSFYLSFGNILHEVFEKLGLSYGGEKEFDFDESWEAALAAEAWKRSEGGAPLTALERLLLRIEKEHVESIVRGYKDYFDHLAKHELHVVSEGAFEIPSSVAGGNFHLKGRFDAVLSVPDQKGGKDFLVVDYKTGSYSFSLDRYRAGLSLQLPIYAYWGRKDGEVVHQSGNRTRVLSPEDRLLGMFVAHVYDKEFPREAKGEGAAYQEVTRELKFQGPFDPSILDSPFVLGKGSSSWIAGIKPTNKEERKAGARDWKIASPGEADLSIEELEGLVGPVGILEEGCYLPSVPEVSILAEELISAWAFPIAPLCLNIDAIDDRLAEEGELGEDEEDSEGNEGEGSSSGTRRKGRKALSYFACKDCSFQDVCYARRDFFRRFGPDFQRKDFHQGIGKIDVKGGDEDA